MGDRFYCSFLGARHKTTNRIADMSADLEVARLERPSTRDSRRLETKNSVLAIFVYSNTIWLERKSRGVSPLGQLVGCLPETHRTSSAMFATRLDAMLKQGV